MFIDIKNAMVNLVSTCNAKTRKIKKAFNDNGGTQIEIFGRSVEGISGRLPQYAEVFPKKQ